MRECLEFIQNLNGRTMTQTQVFNLYFSALFYSLIPPSTSVEKTNYYIKSSSFEIK